MLTEVNAPVATINPEVQKEARDPVAFPEQRVLKEEETRNIFREPTVPTEVNALTGFPKQKVQTEENIPIEEIIVSDGITAAATRIHSAAMIVALIEMTIEEIAGVKEMSILQNPTVI